MDAWASQSLATLYADLTEKIPFLSGRQLVVSPSGARPKKKEVFGYILKEL
jgi:hypothetical protein